MEDSAAAAVWRELLSAVYCQALLAATLPAINDWSVIAVHDATDNDSDESTVEWLVRPPLLVGDLRRLQLRRRTPLAQARTQAVLDNAPGHTPESSPARRTVEPILVALKAVLQRQQAGMHRTAPHSATACSAPGGAHIVLLSRISSRPTSSTRVRCSAMP